MVPKWNKDIDRHFDEILQLPVPQRQSYLDALRQVSPALATKVEALIADLKQAENQSFLDTGDPGMSRMIQQESYGAYRVLSVLGRGGMGTVYLAEQKGEPKRLVALKLVHQSGHGGELLGRFEREKQFLAFLDHRHITKLYDMGTSNAGEPYFVMEYIKGLRIDSFCNSNRLDTRQRLHLFVDVCDALAHAHRKGVIHRDLKPSNVLVKWEQGVAVPKIIDFGVARLMEIAGDDRSDATIIGTPAYMSPEQCVGKADIDTRSDIYSLGVMLYQLLVGVTPHEAGATKVLPPKLSGNWETDFPKPSQVLVSNRASDQKMAASHGISVYRLNAMLRSGLDQICLKALAVEPGHRYQTVLDLVRDIQCFLEHRPISAVPPSIGYRFKRLVRRHKAAVIATCMASLAILIGLISTTMALWRAKEANQQARDAAKLAQSEALKSQAALTALQNMLASPDPYIERRDLPVSELLKRFPQILRDAMVDEETEATLKYTIGRTYFRLGDQPSAARYLQQAVRLRRCLFGEQDLKTQEAEILLTRVWGEQGQIQKAIARSEELFGAAMLAYDSQHPMVREALFNLIAQYIEGRQFAVSDRYVGTALTLAASQADISDLKLVNVTNNAGITAMNLNDFDRAGAYFEMAYLLSEKHLGETHPLTLEIQHNFLTLMGYQGKGGIYLELAASLLTRQETVRGKNHPYTLGAMGMLGHLQLDAGRFIQARASFLKLRDRGEEIFEPGHPRLAFCYQYLSKACYATRHLKEAMAYIRCALRIEENIYGKNSPRAAISSYNLGLICMGLLGQEQLALNALQRAERLFTQHEKNDGKYFTLLALRAFHQREKNEAELDRVMSELAKLETMGRSWTPLSSMFTEGVPWLT